jgi:hypothetical protein
MQKRAALGWAARLGICMAMIAAALSVGVTATSASSPARASSTIHGSTVFGGVTPGSQWTLTTPSTSGCEVFTFASTGNTWTGDFGGDSGVWTGTKDLTMKWTGGRPGFKYKGTFQRGANAYAGFFYTSGPFLFALDPGAQSGC